MSDVQALVLLAAAALAWLYLRPALAREGREEGLAEGREESGGVVSGLRLALVGHAAGLALTIPAYAWLGFERPSGSWLAGLFWLWARFAGALQLAYVVPLALAASRAGRAGELEGLKLAAKLTAAGTAFLWSLDLGRLPGRSLVPPAAAAVAAIGCVLYALLLLARLRRALSAG